MGLFPLCWSPQRATMKIITTSQSVFIPKDVFVKVHNRVVTVKGPRGVLKRSFQMLKINFTTKKTAKGREIVVEKWFGKRKEVAAVRTICTHISNMVKGVTLGFQYKMRAVYAHFPINCVTIQSSPKQKDEFVVEGNCIEAVSQSAASIQQSTTVKHKDIRKFLDGIYVS